MSTEHGPSRRFRRGGSQSFRPGCRPDLPWLCARGLRPVNVPVSIPPSGMLAHPWCASSHAVGLSLPDHAGICLSRCRSGSPGTSLLVCVARAFVLVCACLSPVSTGSLVLHVPELLSTVVYPEWGLAVVGRHVFPTATSWTCLLPDEWTLPPVCTDCPACLRPGCLALCCWPAVGGLDPRVVSPEVDALVSLGPSASIASPGLIDSPWPTSVSM